MNSLKFFEGDFNASLFPLKTNLIVMQMHHCALEVYCKRILSELPEDAPFCFLPQTRAYAAKPRHHLRRTLVLDPVATFYVYDLVLRNRGAFSPTNKKGRRSFGYHFDGEAPVPVHKAYEDFCQEAETSSPFMYAHSISFDIASYFNSIYHHDATNWFSTLPGVSGQDASGFGRFFREINAGRSIDFLPQGIYPTKMIGSAFLRFIDESGELKCGSLLRFMDDIHLFDDDQDVLLQDFYRVQQLLGLKALNINPTKTSFNADHQQVKQEASALGDELAELTGNEDAHVYSASGSDTDWDDDEEQDDDDGESEGHAVDEQGDADAARIERLQELLVDERANENDVELILSILKDQPIELAEYIPGLLVKFPSIVKQLHKLCHAVVDKELLAKELLEIVLDEVFLIEYQLFWIAAIAEDHLSDTEAFGKLILSLYDRTGPYKIARAKILEIPDQTFGLKEIREELLKSGASDWLSWASALGTRTLNKAERNYALKYFSKGSPINQLIAECVQNMP